MLSDFLMSLFWFLLRRYSKKFLCRIKIWLIFDVFYYYCFFNSLPLRFWHLKKEKFVNSLKVDIKSCSLWCNSLFSFYVFFSNLRWVFYFSYFSFFWHMSISKDYIKKKSILIFRNSQNIFLLTENLSYSFS